MGDVGEHQAPRDEREVLAVDIHGFLRGAFADTLEVFQADRVIGIRGLAPPPSPIIARGEHASEVPVVEFGEYQTLLPEPVMIELQQIGDGPDASTVQRLHVLQTKFEVDAVRASGVATW